MQATPVFDPSEMPVRGLLSYPVATALTWGEFQDLINTRLDDRSIRARAGQYEDQSDARTVGTNHIPDVDTGTGGIQQGTFYGGALFRANKTGDWIAVCAINTSGSTVKIFYSLFNTSSLWSGWVIVTNGDGFTSANTFSLPTFGYYEFVAVNNSSGGVQGVYVQNGVDAARYISGLSTPVIVPVSDLQAPRQAQSFAPIAKCSAGVDVRTGAMVAAWPASGTHYTSDGCFDPTAASGTSGNVAQTGSTPDFLWTLLTGTGGTASPAVDDFAWFSAHADDDADFSNGSQVGIVYDGGDETWFSCLKWYLTGTTAGDLLLHDPTDLKDSMFRVPLKQSGVKMAVFSIADFASKDLTDINGVKVVVCDTALTQASTMNIRGVVCLGRVPFGAQYACSFAFGSPEIASSAGVLYNPNAVAERLVESGVSVDETTKLPLDGRMLMSYDVPVFAPSSAQAALGTNVFKVYRRDPGEAESLFGNGENGDFYYVGETTVVEYSSGFVTVNATFGGTTKWSEKAVSGTFVDTKTRDDKDFYDRCPGPYTVSMPIGASMCYGNGSVTLVGARGTSSAARNSGVFVSEKDRPGRYTNVPGDVTEQDRGMFHSLEDENGSKVLAVATSIKGVSQVFCWSDRAMWEVSDIAPVKVCDMGTCAPATVVTQNGAVFWVSQDLEIVRMVGGSLSGISRYTVHDKMAAVPTARRKYMSGAIKASRYYLARASADSTENHRVLVWNDDLVMFESDDSVPVGTPCSQFFKWQRDGESLLSFFTKNGQIWEYEREGTVDDNGTNIDLTVHTHQIKSGWDKIVVGQAQVVCDSQAVTMTVLRTAMFPAGTTSGTLSCAGGGSETKAWRVDVTSAKSVPREEGCAVDVKFTVTVDAPFAIYALRLMYGSSGKGARANQ